MALCSALQKEGGGPLCLGVSSLQLQGSSLTAGNGVGGGESRVHSYSFSSPTFSESNWKEIKGVEWDEVSRMRQAFMKTFFALPLFLFLSPSLNFILPR